MRPQLPLLTLALATASLTACSKADHDYAGNEASRDSVPDIAPSAAPDVAFSYAYRFALAARDIAATQEKHAAACEALGLGRCRITGIAYRRPDAEHVYAELALALAPDIARKFGKDATAAVEDARGTLGDVEIGGEDQSAAIQSSDAMAAMARAARERLEKALADRATPASVKARLHDQIAQQRAAELAAARNSGEARARVATTPVRFVYSTDGYMPGLSIDRTTRAALAFAALVLNGLIALAIVMVTLAVPLGLLLLGAAHGRRLAERIWARLAPQPAYTMD